MNPTKLKLALRRKTIHAFVKMFRAFSYQTDNLTSETRVRKPVFVLVAILAGLVFAVDSFSQGSNGRILGTVSDQTGGVIVGATVTIRDAERGVAANLNTDQAGEYSAPSLLPGTYIVSAEAMGFKKLERQNVELGVGREVRVDLTLQPGSQAEKLTVTEAPPLVETTNATLGGTLQNADINNLPLNGRNYQNLMGLRPGVMLQPGGSPWTQSTNNVRPDENSWMVDGILNANAFDARPVAGANSPFTDGALILPIDAIQEFNLEENPKAEWGGKPGAIVNVGIRSGTNTLHGSAYAFGRDGNWGARNLFNPPPGPGGSCAQPTCNQLAATLEQFGGSVGGPIKKDKLFFFANYEGLRSNIANALVTQVPATAAGLGSAKSMVDAILALERAGVPVSALSEQLMGCPSGALSVASTCTGGVIQNLGAGSASSTSYLSSFPNTNTSDSGIAKINYHINDKHSITGVVYRATYGSDGEDFPMVNAAWENNVLQSAWTTSANWVWTTSSHTVNEFRVGYNRFVFEFLPADRSEFADGSYTLDGVTYPINTGVTSTGGFPTVTVAGFGATQLGSRRGRPLEASPNPYWDFQDNLSYLLGKHDLKFGGQFSHIEGDSNAHDTRGQINFLGGQASAAFPALAAISPSGTSSALEDFFAGLPGRGSQLTGDTSVRVIQKVYALFAQDDYRLTTKLMVNLGLRWTYDTPFHEVNNLLGSFSPNLGLVQEGYSPLRLGNYLWKPDHNNFSPRIGFAWDVTGKGTTVVRGGGSILYSLFSLAPYTGNPGIANVPGGTSIAAVPTGGCTVKVAVGQTCSGVGGTTLTPGGTISTGTVRIPASALDWNGVVFPTGGAVSCTAPLPCSVGAVDPNLKTPYVDTWNLGVTHGFTNNLSLEVQYVGTHGGHLIGSIDLNQAPLGAAYCLNNSLTAAQVAGDCAPGNPILPIIGSPDSSAVQQARPYLSQYPYLQFINWTTNYAYSNYNSLQATLTQRLNHGVSFTVGYTYGHALDNGSLNRFAGQPQNALDPAAEYSSSDFDVRNRATITVSYDIPGKKGYGQLLEGWKINSIVTLASPQPWNIIDGTNNFSGTLENTDRWDFFGNPSDFKDTSSSIPYCSGFPADFLTSGGADLNGVTCNTTSGVSTLVTALPSSLASTCKAAPDIRTLAVAGCFVEGNSVMVPPAAGTFGTMARNIFRDAGFKVWDFSIFKNFIFKERFGVEFRAEFFNILNHPNITNPFGSVNGYAGGSDPSSPTSFGCGCTTPDIAAGNPIVGSGDSRQIQLGLKLTF